MKNKGVIALRKAYKDGILTNQQFKTLKGLWVAGEYKAVEKGYKKIAKRKKEVGDM